MSLSNELAKRFPEATVTQRVSLPVTAAPCWPVSRASRRECSGLLEPVRPYDHAPSAVFWPAYLRGQAYLRLKDGRAASVQFQSILEHRGEVPASALYPLATSRAGACSDPGQRHDDGPEGLRRLLRALERCRSRISSR